VSQQSVEDVEALAAPLAVGDVDGGPDEARNLAALVEGPGVDFDVHPRAVLRAVVGLVAAQDLPVEDRRE
jgi:hypothetical protein